MRHTTINAPFSTQKNYHLFLIVLSLCTFLSCSSSIKQFYDDTYYPEDNIYNNKAIRFCMTFRGRWNIITEPDQMNKNYKSFAKTLQRTGGELLFMGSTVEQLYGTKALAINLNEPADDYAAYIRKINKKDLERDSTPTPFITEHIHAVKWIYDKAGYRFVEFFFTIDTYNIRLSFWSRPELFNNFLPVFEEITSTISFTAGF